MGKNRKSIAQQKYDGTYTYHPSSSPQDYPPPPSMVGEQSQAVSALGEGHPMSVVEATPIPTGREPSGTRLSAEEMRRREQRGRLSGANYDNGWAASAQDAGSKGSKSAGGSRGGGAGSSYDYDYYEGSQYRMSSDSGPLTDMRGVRGTSGKSPRRMNTRQFADLIKEGYSKGLAHALSENASRYDFRFWVVDNSGSMQIGDGHRQVRKDGKWKAVACTRWEEIKDTVKYHAQMASTLDCPTIFQLLNDPGMRTAPQKFSVGEHGPHEAQAEVAKAIEILRKVSPSGVTPLTQHIWNIEEAISDMAAELRRSGRIVAIILATDGLPTDELGYGGNEITDEFIRALRSLEGLPVWMVIRLCTDEVAVKQFYNSLDAQLEISLEVLDDYMGEAREVYKQNPWITYGLPLHRCRELGYHDRLFDLIDERPLTAGEVRSFCCFIFGVKEQELPDPGVDASEFLKAVKQKLEEEQLQWNPMKKKMTPWVLVKELKKSFSGRNCVIM